MLTVRTQAATRRGAPPWERLAAAACLLFVLGVVVVQIGWHGSGGQDFAIDYRAAMDLRSAVSPSVATSARLAGQAGGNGYFYAPTFAILVLPLTLLPLQAARVVWGLCSLAFLLAAIYALARAAGKRPSALFVFALADLAVLMTGVRSELYFANVNLFLLACVSFALWARQEQRPVVGGVLLALACATKPMWLLLPIFFLWKREYRFAGGALGIFFGLLLVPFAWLGLHSLNRLLGVWGYFVANYLGWTGNYAIFGVLTRLFTKNVYIHPIVDAPLLGLALWLVISGAVTLATLAMLRRQPLERDTRSLLEVGAMVCAVLLISPLVEAPYLSLLVVTLVAAALRFAEEPPLSPLARLAAVGLAAAWLVEAVPQRFLQYDAWIRAATTTPADYVFMVLGATDLYVILAAFLCQLLLLRRGADRPSVPTLPLIRRARPPAPDPERPAVPARPAPAGSRQSLWRGE